MIGRLWAQLLKQEERIGQLEGRLKPGSRNSSKPPSSDGLAKPLRLKGLRPVGGQKGHEGTTLRQSARVDEIITHQSAGLPGLPGRMERARSDRQAPGL